MQNTVLPFLKGVNVILPSSTPLTHRLTHATQDLCPVGLLKHRSPGMRSRRQRRKPNANLFLRSQNCFSFPLQMLLKAHTALPDDCPTTGSIQFSLAPGSRLNLLAAGVESTQSFKMESPKVSGAYLYFPGSLI